MSRPLISNFVNRTCSHCKHPVPEEGFFRKGKVWKTCNECSAKAYDQRKAETAHATAVCDALDLRMAALRISQQQQFNLMVQQQEFDRHQFHQQQFEQQWQQQRDPRMTLDYLLADPDVYGPSPLELYEQYRRLNHQTQQLFRPETFQSQSDQQPVTYQNPQPWLYVQPFLTYPPDPNQGADQGPNQGMLPVYELLNFNVYSNLEALANGGEQADDNWDDLGSGDQEINFEACLENALRVDLQEQHHGNGIAQSFLKKPTSTSIWV